LNSHFLKDLEHINLIKETINEVSNDYKEDETVDVILLWDVMKMQIRANSIKYAKQQKAKQKQTAKTLETEILKCYYDQKYEFFVSSIFRKYKYILLTVQSFKSKFVREVRLF